MLPSGASRISRVSGSAITRAHIVLWNLFCLALLCSAGSTYRVMESPYRVMGPTYRVMVSTYRVMGSTYRVMGSTYLVVGYHVVGSTYRVMGSTHTKLARMMQEKTGSGLQGSLES
eukprot:gene16631-biopygen23286